MAKISNARMNNTAGGMVFDFFNIIFLSSFALLAILPFLYIIAGSFASTFEFRTRDFFIIPQTFNIQSYAYIFSSQTLMNSALVSLLRTLLGTVISMFCTVTMAYALARRDLVGRSTILNVIIFCMVFSGGMVPTFLIVRTLGLFDTIWALVLPGAISISSLIIIKTFFQDLPAGLEESARIDGANDLQVLIRIVLPLSGPVIATFSLFYAVAQWNAFFDALIYLNNTALWPLQLVMRQMVMQAQSSLGDGRELDAFLGSVPEEGMKMAVIVVSMLPIMMVYPFLQKHFAKGAMIGAIKG